MGGSVEKIWHRKAQIRVICQFRDTVVLGNFTLFGLAWSYVKQQYWAIECVCDQIVIQKLIESKVSKQEAHFEKTSGIEQLMTDMWLITQHTEISSENLLEKTSLESFNWYHIVWIYKSVYHAATEW